MTDAEWALLAGLIPPAKRGGNARTVNLREAVNGLLCLLGTGCQWRDREGPAAAQHAAWRLHALGMGRHARADPPRALCAVPRAGRARGQPDRGDHRQPQREERGKRGPSINPHGDDGGKKIKGRKRHVLVDTLGLMLHAAVHSAGLQDRDGGVLVMATLFGMFPFLRNLDADAGYQGPKFQAALKRVLRQVRIQIVRRSDTAKGFEVLSRRRVVERTIAWLNRCRRPAKDCENLSRTALAFLRLASIRLKMRRLCRP